MELVFGKILSIFLIIGVGFVANKVDVMPMAANKYLVGILIRVTCPCMIVASITSNDLQDDTLSLSLLTLAGGAVFFAVSALLGWVLSSKIIKVEPSSNVGVYTYAFGSINSGFIGFPITLAIFGSGILYLMVIHNVVLNLYIYTFGILLVNLGASGGRLDFRDFLNSFKNINALAAIVSIFMLFAGLKLPTVIFDCVDMIGDATTPLSMLIVGMQLGDCDFREVLKNRKLLGISLLKMLLLPVLTFLLVNWLPLDVSVKVCLIFAASFPVAVAVVPVTSEQNRDSLIAAEMVAITTLFSLAVIPAVATFLLGYYGLS
ncbi:MAG: AEC family transporter [Anaerovoracaceae bacterium]